MFPRLSPIQSLDRPQETLVATFILWKSVLLIIAAYSPGPGYDTSTTLAQPYDNLADLNSVVSLMSLLSKKLTRWDAIYFTSIAKRDYLFEQDWAFGWGFTRLIRFFASCLKRIGVQDYGFLESLVGIGLSHVAHGLSVLALYHLAHAVLRNGHDRKFPFIAACLHIFSPAGLFLSAPYGESTFSMLSFFGYLLFVKSFNFQRQTTPRDDILIVASGAVLGFATTVRNNGLLNGLLFLEEAIRLLYSLKNGVELSTIRRIIATGIGGLCIAMGFIIPQFIAFQKFCGNQISDDQPLQIWCTYTLPSIYSFVQGYYWNVGFLRYWTLSNIPLFFLAVPMLSIMMISALAAMWYGSNVTSKPRPSFAESLENLEPHMLRSLAIPQFALAFLALTSYHVQIIIRLSSGYCVWYFWLARTLIFSVDDILKPQTDRRGHWRVNTFGLVICIIVYAAVQGGLFSSFLPPA